MDIIRNGYFGNLFLDDVAQINLSCLDIELSMDDVFTHIGL